MSWRYMTANYLSKHSNGTGTLERTEEHGLANSLRRDAMEDSSGDARNVGGDKRPKILLASKDGDVMQDLTRN